MPARPKILPSASQLKNIGNALVGQGRFKEAIVIYSRALAGDDGCQIKEIWSNRSAAYLSLGEPRLALSDGYRCCCIDRAWAKGYLRVVNAANALDLPAEALEACLLGIAVLSEIRNHNDSERKVWRVLQRFRPLLEARLQECMFFSPRAAGAAITDATTTNDTVVHTVEVSHACDGIEMNQQKSIEMEGVDQMDQGVNGEIMRSDQMTPPSQEIHGNPNTYEGCDTSDSSVMMESFDELRLIQEHPCWSEFMYLMDSCGPSQALSWARSQITASELLHRLASFLQTRLGMKVNIEAAQLKGLKGERDVAISWRIKNNNESGEVRCHMDIEKDGLRIDLSTGLAPTSINAGVKGNEGFPSDSASEGTTEADDSTSANEDDNDNDFGDVEQEDDQGVGVANMIVIPQPVAIGVCYAGQGICLPDKDRFVHEHFVEGTFNPELHGLTDMLPTISTEQEGPEVPQPDTSPEMSWYHSAEQSINNSAMLLEASEHIFPAEGFVAVPMQAHQEYEQFMYPYYVWDYSSVYGDPYRHLVDSLNHDAQNHAFYSNQVSIDCWYGYPNYYADTNGYSGAFVSAGADVGSQYVSYFSQYDFASPCITPVNSSLIWTATSP